MACLLLTGQLPPTVQCHMKELVNGREEVTRATVRDFIFLIRRVLTEKGINLVLGYNNKNRVMVTEHIHEKPLATHTVPLLGGDPGSPQNQSPPGPTQHDEFVAGVIFEAKCITGANSRESKWNINLNMAQDQQAAILELLLEYSDEFATNPKSPNTAHVAYHVININYQLSIKAKNILVSPQTGREINVQVEQMLPNGIIRPSASPWASRVILVKKKDQTLRFAVDSRSLNDITTKDSSPPRSQRYKGKLSGCEFFSIFDGLMHIGASRSGRRIVRPLFYSLGPI